MNELLAVQVTNPTTAHKAVGRNREVFIRLLMIFTNDKKFPILPLLIVWTIYCSCKIKNIIKEKY